MTEEVKRIEEVKRAQQRAAASQSTDLTGEEVFIRSCNTCHPRGRKGMGPALDQIGKDFPSDAALKNFIRAGKGMMPPQTRDAVNDKELDNLVAYLRNMQ